MWRKKKKRMTWWARRVALLYHAATQTEDLGLESQETGSGWCWWPAGLPACPPGKAAGPVSDSVRPTASEEDIWCWPQRNKVVWGWGWGSWVPLKYNLKILARGSIGLSSLGAVQDRSGALAYHAGDPRSDVRHHTHTHTKHTCTCAHGSFIAVLP